MKSVWSLEVLKVILNEVCIISLWATCPYSKCTKSQKTEPGTRTSTSQIRDYMGTRWTSYIYYVFFSEMTFRWRQHTHIIWYTKVYISSTNKKCLKTFKTIFVPHFIKYLRLNVFQLPIYSGKARVLKYLNWQSVALVWVPRTQSVFSNFLWALPIHHNVSLASVCHFYLILVCEACVRINSSWI